MMNIYTFTFQMFQRKMRRLIAIAAITIVIYISLYCVMTGTIRSQQSDQTENASLQVCKTSLQNCTSVNQIKTASHEFTKFNNRVKLTIRMPAEKKLISRFLCWCLRSAVLFWHHQYGDIVIILDETDEAKADYFPGKLQNLNLSFTYQIIYEKEPKQAENFKEMSKRVYNRGYGYNLQLYSFFIMDKYFHEDDIIAYTDTDAVGVGVVPLLIGLLLWCQKRSQPCFD